MCADMCRFGSLVVMDVVQVDLRKWPDTAHWRYSGHLLGEDSHGVWLHVPSWATAQRASEAPRQVKAGFVMLVDESKWWTANFYMGHPFLSVYVNISTPPKWSGTRLRAVDLDLDVIRDVNGRVAVLDEDEFALHQETLSYPADLTVQTRQATDAALQLVAEGAEPFGTAANPWLKQAQESEEQGRP